MENDTTDIQMITKNTQENYVNNIDNLKEK